MKIAAITKFRNGVLWHALEQLGWTQAELARRACVHQTTVGAVMSLRQKPSPKLARRIQRALGAAGVYIDVFELWPETFTGLGQSLEVTQYADVDPLLIAGVAQPRRALPNGADRILADIMAERLTPRQQQLLRWRFGLDGLPLTLSQCADKLGVTKETIRQHTAKALRKLRHPDAMVKLEDLLQWEHDPQHAAFAQLESGTAHA